MKLRRPRDYDPLALQRMPDEPPRGETAATPERWVRPEEHDAALYATGHGPRGRAQPGQRSGQRSPREYYAYLGQSGAGHEGWQAAGGLVDLHLAPNRYGFRSKAQELYPQTYKELNTDFWRMMSEEAQKEVMRRQAAAQERVGFERATQKFFIEGLEIAGPLGPGEEPSATELLTEFDTDYALRRKAYHRRMVEREEIRQGKRKRYNQYTASRDEANCPVLGLPSVVKGVRDTPALKSVLPGAEALLKRLERETAGSLDLVKPAVDSPGLQRLRNRKRPTSYRDLPLKHERLPASKATQPVPAAPGTAASGALAALGKRQASTARKFNRQAVQLGTRNKYGLTSRSELSYPSAYAPVAPELWAGLTDDERKRQYVVQATAQEKAGFEKDAPKFFIDNFDPGQARAPNTRERREEQAADLRAGAAVARVAAAVFVALVLLALLAWWGLSGLR